MVAPKSSKSLAAGGCLTLFGLPFLGAGLFLSWLYFSGYVKWWGAQTWQEVPCWIESAELKRNSGGESDTHKAHATYRYEFEGRVYQGDRVSFHGGSDNIGDFQEKAHRELSLYVGGESSGAERDPQRDTRKPFRCYVNPDKPDESVLYRVFRWQMQAFMAMFALTFPAVGAGLVAGGIVAVRAAKKDLALKAIHPEQPWLWKSDWAGPSIPESLGLWRKWLYLYTVWSGLVILPLIVTTAMTGAFRSDEKASFLLAFVLVWCIPAWFSLRRFRQYLAVGSPRFEMARIPANPGGVLEGAVLFGHPPAFRGDSEFVLMCVRQLTRKTSDGDSTATEKIWSHTQHVPMNQITHDVSGFRLTVAIALPLDAPQSGTSDDPAITHVWSLRLTVQGTGIRPMFEVPVFRTGKSSAMIANAAVPSISETAASDLPAQLAEQRIKADFDLSGMPLSIIRPPARHRSMIVFMLVFNLIWTAVAVFLVKKDAPLVFQIVWLFSSGVIWLSILWQLLYQRTVTFARDGLKLRHQLGPFSREETLQKSQITGFSHDTNMTSNNVNFYRIRLECVPGKKKTVADGINRSTTAEALVQRLQTWKKSG